MATTLLIVMFGASLLGGFAGFLGVFPFLKQHSLLGDALSHAMLPGIACAFLLSKHYSPLLLLIGAVTMGLITSWIFVALERHTRLKRDAILGILLSSFFGLGIVLITLIQKKAYAHSAVIQRFFFGNASTITASECVVIAAAGMVCTIIVGVLWKEIQMYLFDPLYAKALQYSIVWIERIVMFIFVVTLALGLQIAGVILMSSFLIAPAAAARQWVNSVKNLCKLSAFVGALSGFGGSLISYYYSLPTGPTIVMCLTVWVLFSLLFSPSRGALRVLRS